MQDGRTTTVRSSDSVENRSNGKRPKVAEDTSNHSQDSPADAEVCAVLCAITACSSAGARAFFTVLFGALEADRIPD